MKKLNELMFPMINKNVENLLITIRTGIHYNMDAAILFDAGLDRFCDKIIYLTADDERTEKNF